MSWLQTVPRLVMSKKYDSISRLVRRAWRSSEMVRARASCYYDLSRKVGFLSMRGIFGFGMVAGKLFLLA